MAANDAYFPSFCQVRPKLFEAAILRLPGKFQDELRGFGTAVLLRFVKEIKLRTTFLDALVAMIVTMG